jgi:hypothetical protein
LESVVEMQNQDGTYNAKSIIGILRTHFILNQDDGVRIYDQSIDTAYDILSKGRITDKPGVLTEEAHVTFHTKKKILVTNRNA